MNRDDRAIMRKRALDAIAAALAGWLVYALVQHGTRIVMLGALIDLVYMFCVYLFMPFAFSGALFVLLVYAGNRLCGRCARDTGLTLLLLAALALSFYVTAPVVGEIAVVKGTAVFLVLRLVRQFVQRAAP